MTDLEMTRLCAEAMGIALGQPTTWRDAMGGLRSIPSQAITDVHLNDSGENYDPLYDDAQAMALVKKFKLLVNNGVGCSSTDLWHVQTQDDRDESVECQTLNRAIVECVAKMQAASSKAGEQR